jgi:MbtH protein
VNDRAVSCVQDHVTAPESIAGTGRVLAEKLSEWSGSMSNPFEDPDAEFLVLINAEGQHSLWPVFAKLPAGWTAAHGPASHQGCLDYVESSWMDMRPKSLVERMAEG